MVSLEQFAFAVLVFFYGALLGSFGNVLILRIPKNEDWVKFPSHCVFCNKNLKWWMNIPLLSFVILRGKCHYCSKKISNMYPIVELISGLKSLFIYYNFQNFSSHTMLMLIIYDLIFLLLLVHFVIDLKHKILPDVVSLALLLLGIILTHLKGNYSNAIFGGAVGFFSTLLITYLFYQVRGQVGLGGGDIKLFGIVGIFLGPHGVIQTLFLSSILGILIALIIAILKRSNVREPFAFGPSIITVFILQLYFPQIFSVIDIGKW